MTSVARIKVKTGNLELEFEGSESFLKSDFLALIQEIKTSLNIQASDQKSKVLTPNETALDIATLTTSTVAQKLGVKSGPELALAACIALTIGKGMTSIPRKDILQEMKDATAYYRDSYSGNLSAALKALVTSGQINSIGTETYALSAKSKKDAEEKLKDE